MKQYNKLKSIKMLIRLKNSIIQNVSKISNKNKLYCVK